MVRSLVDKLTAILINERYLDPRISRAYSREILHKSETMGTVNNAKSYAKFSSLSMF